MNPYIKATLEYLEAKANIFRLQAAETKCPLKHSLLEAQSTLTSLRLKQIEDRHNSLIEHPEGAS